jgi:hypothetical protein
VDRLLCKPVPASGAAESWFLVLAMAIRVLVVVLSYAVVEVLPPAVAMLRSSLQTLHYLLATSIFKLGTLQASIQGLCVLAPGLLAAHVPVMSMFRLVRVTRVEM